MMDTCGLSIGMKSNSQLKERYEGGIEQLISVFDEVAGKREATADAYPLIGELSQVRNRYQLLEPIGQGGMKQVYLAEDVATGQRLALATLGGEITHPRSEAFLREARVNASLIHPNVIRIYDIGFLSDGRPFFTMTLMPDRSLGDLLRQRATGKQGSDRTLSSPELLDIFVKICDAMIYAHARGVLHFDLKPDNVQVGHYGEVFVCDWGLACIRGEDTAADENSAELNPDTLNHMTMRGVVKGTLGYMAPEQAAGTERGPATDVYGLGAILYSILTLRAPISRDDGGDLLHLTRTGDIISPDRRNPETPAALAAICMKALAMSPRDRYVDVKTLQEDLLRYQAGFATQAENAGFTQLLGLLIRRNRRLFTVGVAAAVLFAVGTAIFVVQLEGQRQLAVDARQLAESATTEAVLAQQKEEVAKGNAVDARLAAESSEKAAVAARMRSEESLAALAQEQNARLSMAKQNAVSLVAANRMALATAKFADALQAIDSAVDLDPDNNDAWMQKGVTHLIHQQFSAALAAFDHDRAKLVPDLRDLAQFMKTRKPVDDEALTAQQFIAMLSKLRRGRVYLRRHMYFFDLGIKRPATDRALVAEMMIQLENPGSGQVSLRTGEYPIGLGLKLTGKGVQVLHITREIGLANISLLSGMRVSQLDLSDTGVGDLTTCGNLPHLQQLNVVGTPVVDLKPLTAMPKLQTLIVGASQFSDKTLASLPKKIKIVKQ